MSNEIKVINLDSLDLYHMSWRHVSSKLHKLYIKKEKLQNKIVYYEMILANIQTEEKRIESEKTENKENEKNGI